VYAGLAAAIVASIAGALELSRLPLDEEITEGVLLLAAGALTVTLVVWMQRHGRTFKRDIEERMGRITAPAQDAGTGGRAAAFGVGAFTFYMVFREGMETVLLLAAVNLESESLLSFLGGLAGLALAVAFGVALVKGAVKIDLPRFFRITAILLYLFAAQMFVSGFHELAEGGVLPLGKSEMQIIGPIVKAQSLFLAALLALPVILLLVPGRRPAADPAASAPERRRFLADARRERFWRTAASLAGIAIIVSLTASYAYTRVPAALDAPRMLPAGGDTVRVPLAGLAPATLYRFGVESNGSVIRFLVSGKDDGTWLTAFDACDICGPKGYVSEGGRLVCRNCAADIPPASLGTGGGCNPVPLPSKVEGGDLVIARADLFGRAALFAGETAGLSVAPRP
jgi:FTR1 family protein